MVGITALRVAEHTSCAVRELGPDFVRQKLMDAASRESSNFPDVQWWLVTMEKNHSAPTLRTASQFRTNFG
jgi:hypothetical protein